MLVNMLVCNMYEGWRMQMHALRYVICSMQYAGSLREFAFLYSRKLSLRSKNSATLYVRMYLSWVCTSL